MITIVGLIVVFGSVLGGFAMAGGPFPVLIQPNELVVIGGAALGTVVMSSPGAVGKRIINALKSAMKPHVPTKDDYSDLLKLLFQIFTLMRKEGVLALEGHLQSVEKSAIFSKYPSVLARHHEILFLQEALRQLVDGCSVSDLVQMLDGELETHHEEAHQPINLIRTTGDALPGLGIVAAVLGIVITMGHLDGGPEVIGHHVAAALVGTFLGILLCYGMIAPIATNLEMQSIASHRYLTCIKEGVIAAARGLLPSVCIEFARRSIFSDERPTAAEMEKAFESLKG